MSKHYSEMYGRNLPFDYESYYYKIAERFQLGLIPPDKYSRLLDTLEDWAWNGMQK